MAAKGNIGKQLVKVRQHKQEEVNSGNLTPQVGSGNSGRGTGSPSSMDTDGWTGILHPLSRTAQTRSPVKEGNLVELKLALRAQLMKMDKILRGVTGFVKDKPNTSMVI